MQADTLSACPASYGWASSPRGYELAGPGLLLDFAVLQQDTTPLEGHPRPALYVPALEEGVTGVAVVILGTDGTLLVRVDDEEVGIGSDPDHAFARV
jgi:hypothetical protein